MSDYVKGRKLSCPETGGFCQIRACLKDGGKYCEWQHQKREHEEAIERAHTAGQGIHDLTRKLAAVESLAPLISTYLNIGHPVRARFEAALAASASNGRVPTEGDIMRKALLRGAKVYTQAMIDALPEADRVRYYRGEGLPESAPKMPIPDGWKLVPLYVTDEMQRAYFDVIDRNMYRVTTDAGFGRHESAKEAYRAMLKAAPDWFVPSPAPKEDIRG